MNIRTLRATSDIKGMVQAGKQVQFVRFQAGVLWYATECGFEFPVPAAETGEASYLARDKAILFMRFIRQHILALEAAQKEALGPPDACEARVAC